MNAFCGCFVVHTKNVDEFTMWPAASSRYRQWLCCGCDVAVMWCIIHVIDMTAKCGPLEFNH